LKSARQALGFLLAVYKVVSVTQEDCINTMSVPIEDFEDALHADLVCHLIFLQLCTDVVPTSKRLGYIPQALLARPRKTKLHLGSPCIQFTDILNDIIKRDPFKEPIAFGSIITLSGIELPDKISHPNGSQFFL